VRNSACNDLKLVKNAFFAPSLAGGSEDGLGCCSEDFVLGEARPSHPGLVLFDHESCSRLDAESVLNRFLFASEALSPVFPSNPPPETSGATPASLQKFCGIQFRVQRNEGSIGQDRLVPRGRESVVGDRAEPRTLQTRGA
jgi:hypothetical protein